MGTEIIGVSQNIERIKELIKQVADTGLNTLVCGETGVGKELVVQKLYEQSNRMGKPFIKVNCFFHKPYSFIGFFFIKKKYSCNTG